MRLNRIWDRTSDELSADEVNNIHSNISNSTADICAYTMRKSTTIPFRKSSVLQADTLQNILPNIVKSTKKTGDSRRNSNVTESRRNSNVTESRRNSNSLQEIIKDILPSYDEELEINNNNDLLPNVDEVDDDNNTCCGKPMAMKQIKNILYKSCIFSLKASVLLLGHLLLSLLKILALI